MAVEIAGMAAKAVETGKKVVEVAKKAEKVVSTVEKPVKAVEKITADKDGNWGADIVKSGVQKGVGEVKSGLADKLKDYLGKDDINTSSVEAAEGAGEQVDTKDTKNVSDVQEDKGGLKDKLNKYLDSADSQTNTGNDIQNDDAAEQQTSSENGESEDLNPNKETDSGDTSEVNEEAKEGNNENDSDTEQTSKTFTNLDDMKSELGKTYKEIKEDKPMNSPELKKWFEKGGKIEISEENGKQVWTYINPEGIAVKYVDGYPVFPPETKHPFIGDLSIGEFTGDRTKDKELYLEVLEEEYGLTEIPEGYALHHDSENGVMQLVKEEYHKEFTHSGGHSKFKEVAEC